MRFRLGVPLSDPALRRIGALMVPGLFGVGIVQINVVVGQYLASFLALGSISSLFFAGRVTELPLGVFAVAIATVVLPLMSRQAARGDLDRMLETLNFAIRQVMLITLPAAVGMVVLRSEIISVLFQRGAFGQDSVDATAAALAAYAVGLVAVAGIRVIAPAFFAQRDTRTPVITAAVAMVVNIAACLALIPNFQHVGIALGNVIAAYCNVALLLLLMRRKMGPFGGRRLLAATLRLSAAAAAMGSVVWVLRQWWVPPLAGGFLLRAAWLGAVIAVGVVVYGAAIAALRALELAELMQLRTRRAP